MLMMMALMTSKNNPKVKIVIGNVKITKIGFTNPFNKLITNATQMAVKVLFKDTPGSNLAMIMIASAFTNN